MFIPRRRTEFLVAEALAVTTPGAVVVDLCCGSGALGAAVAAEQQVSLYAADIELAAVRCAERNLEPSDGAVYQGDLYDALPASSADGSTYCWPTCRTYRPTRSGCCLPKRDCTNRW